MASRRSSSGGTAALVIAAVLPSGHGGGQARHVGPQPQAQTAAYVVSRTAAALSTAAAENSVVQVSTSIGSGDRIHLGVAGDGWYSPAAHEEDTWYHGPDSNGPLRDQGFTAAGQPVFDSGTVQTLGIYTTTIVDYQARIWWRDAQHVTPWIPPPTSGLSCGDLDSFAINMDPTYWAADLQKALSCGVYVTSGTEQVDGVNAIKLTPVRPGVVTAVLWVNPSTYLPIRVEMEFKGRPDGRIEDVQWLPPTAANLAKLTAPIPSGFVQVPAPPVQCPISGKPAKVCSAASAWYAQYVAPRL
jgi:hypothetical protein